MRWQGSIQVADDEFLLMAQDCPPETVGFFFYGNTQPQVPFGDGFRCVGPRLFRFPSSGTDAFGYAWHQLDYSQPSNPAGTILPGSTWSFQYLYRDPGHGTQGFNLSDGLSVAFQ